MKKNLFDAFTFLSLTFPTHSPIVWSKHSISNDKRCEYFDTKILQNSTRILKETMFRNLEDLIKLKKAIRKLKVSTFFSTQVIQKRCYTYVWLCLLMGIITSKSVMSVIADFNVLISKSVEMLFSLKSHFTTQKMVI